MNDQQQWTYNAIVSRCRNLIPSIDIVKHIKPGTLEVKNLTLDGINFEANNPANLEAELGGRMKLPGAEKLPVPGLGALSFDTTRGPRSPNASMTSMKEEPDHWALKASFGATIGEGFREEFQPPPATSVPLLPEPSYGSQRLAVGFGENSRMLKFTALHAAVSPRGCNIHIDERGFVVKLPEGAVVTPTFWGHIANELLLKTKVRDWLKGTIGDNLVGAAVVEVVNRLSLRFPDAENGFAGLENRVNNISGLKDLGGIGKAIMPIGLTADLARFENSTVQANYYSYDGQKTLTISWGGTFEAFGSK